MVQGQRMNYMLRKISIEGNNDDNDDKLPR